MNSQITCIILDDEPFAVQLLKQYTEKVSFLKLLYAGTDVYKAMDILKNQSVDLVFLDIQMPELTGIEFMQTVHKEQNFIITSAYQEYALEAFDFNVIDYLLKPITFQRFYQSLEKYTQWKNQFTKKEESADLIVKSDKKHYRIPLESILYIEGLSDYNRIHTTDKKLVVYDNLKDILKKLPSDRFMRIHRSYIVSINNISMLEGNRLWINDNTPLPIGETYRKQVREYFKG